MNGIIICEYGWILCGKIVKHDERVVRISEGSIVRSWRNGRGIGALATVEHKDDYTLDYIGDVDIVRNKVLFTIPCEW